MLYSFYAKKFKIFEQINDFPPFGRLFIISNNVFSMVFLIITAIKVGFFLCAAGETKMDVLDVYFMSVSKIKAKTDRTFRIERPSPYQKGKH